MGSKIWDCGLTRDLHWHEGSCNLIKEKASKRGTRSKGEKTHQVNNIKCLVSKLKPRVFSNACLWMVISNVGREIKWKDNILDEM